MLHHIANPVSGRSEEKYKEAWSRLEHAKLNTSRVFNALENARQFMAAAPGFKECDGSSFADFEVVQSLLCGASCILREMYIAMVEGDGEADSPPDVL